MKSEDKRAQSKKLEEEDLEENLNADEEESFGFPKDLDLKRGLGCGG